MPPRKLIENEVKFEIRAEPEDMPVRGNLIDGGPGYEEADRELEDEIIARLDNGDIWAWCFVTVTAKWGNFEGKDSLGACSYESEKDFTGPGGDYYADMRREALGTLNAQIAEAWAAVRKLEGGSQ